MRQSHLHSFVFHPKRLARSLDMQQKSKEYFNSFLKEPQDIVLTSDKSSSVMCTIDQMTPND